MSLFHGVREFFTPHADEGSYMEKGIVNAKEFVEAGDFLVYKCPTWKWASGEPSKRKSYLPSNKQYLVTRNVPCSRRCIFPSDEYPEKQEGEWTVFDANNTDTEPIDVDEAGADKVQIDGANKNSSERTATMTLVDSFADWSIKDMGRGNVASSFESNCHGDEDEDEDDGFYDANEDSSVVGMNENIVLTRSYDVYLTWDKHYRTPRVWLFGYDEHRNPLNHKQMFEDVSPEHANKTVTYDMHPHENYMSLSIHPCKHASVMKILIARWNDREKQRLGADAPSLRVDQYLFLFLKFIGTIIPTVEYDYSFNM